MARRTISRRPRDDESTPRFSDEQPTRLLDEGDEEPPRRRGRSRRDEEQDEAPRTRRSARSHDEDDEPRSARRSRRDEDEPRERVKSTAGKGWGGFDEVKKYGRQFMDRWDVPEKPTLIKFLEPEPFSTYAEHFIEELPKGTKKGYICLGDDCPLCDSLGDRPSGYALFNILDLADPDNPKNAFLRASKGLAQDIQTFANDKRSKPIDRWDVYFTIHRKREAGARYKLDLVKGRDIEEDFDFEPFTEDELEEFRDGLVNEDQVVTIDTRKKLKDVVDLLDDLAS